MQVKLGLYKFEIIQILLYYCADNGSSLLIFMWVSMRLIKISECTLHNVILNERSEIILFNLETRISYHYKCALN